MKNSIKDVTRLGSRVTTHEISKVESPDPVKKSLMLKVREGVSVRVVFSFLLFTMFTMGFGVALAIALVAVGPIHEGLFKVLFTVMVLAETIICFASVILYRYVKGNLVEKDEKPTDTGPTKHPSDLADRCMRGEGKDIIG